MIIDRRHIQLATGYKVKVYNSCKSTFDKIGNNDVVIALAQKRGAGRGDHTFFSPRGGLYIVQRETKVVDPHTLTPAVGLAVHDAVKAVTGRDTELKWVNDVMYAGKKVAGILVRSPRPDEYLIGVGINYFTDKREFERVGLFDACSLGAERTTATAFCTELISRIHLAAVESFNYHKYTALCRTIGKHITFSRDGATLEGYAEGLERDGSLIVRIGSATVVVDAGEVSIVRENGD